METPPLERPPRPDVYAVPWLEDIQALEDAGTYTGSPVDVL